MRLRLLRCWRRPRPTAVLLVKRKEGLPGLCGVTLDVGLRGRSQLAETSRVTFKAPAPELATPAAEGKGLMISMIVLVFRF